MKTVMMAMIGIAGLAAASQGAVTTYFTNLSGAAEAPAERVPWYGLGSGGL